MKTLDCADEFGTCSHDHCLVFSGGARPLQVCGRHVRYGLSQATYRKADK